MGTSEAAKALLKSLSQDSSTPDFGAENREDFLKAARDELRAVMIEPVPVTAFTTEWVRTYAELSEGSYEMLAVAGAGDFWLLYDPDTGLFSLANGSLEGKLVLVGFHSEDALAEWRG